MRRTPVRVLFLLPTLDGGGAERVTLHLLRHLDPQTCQATLFVFQPKGDYWKDVPKDIRVIIGANSEAHQQLAAVTLLRRLISAARLHDLVVACLQNRTTYVAWLAGAITSRPVIGWIQNSAVPGSPMLKARHRFLSRQIYPRLTTLVCASHGVSDSLSAFMPLRPKRVKVIPSFIDREMVATLACAELPGAISTARKEPLLFAMGRLVPQKGFDVLLRSIRQLHDSGQHVRALIVGEGGERSNLQRLIADLGLGGYVEMPGFAANPFPVMRQADIFVLSSRFEGFALVLLEAMALGLPIVATDCIAGPSEILEKGRCGMLVPPEDHKALASAVSRMLRNRELAEHFRAAATARLQDFEPTHIVAQWQSLFRGVTEGQVGR
jgi:glycosyltransferase involved in cell wall biosynthesis